MYKWVIGHARKDVSVAFRAVGCESEKLNGGMKYG